MLEHMSLELVVRVKGKVQLRFLGIGIRDRLSSW